MKKHRADSETQRKIENKQFKRFQEKHQIPALKQNPSLPLNSNPICTIVPDFYSEAAGVIGEIHTHPGKLKPSQSKKVAADVLKMLLYEKDCGHKLKKYLIVCSEEEYKQLTGSSNLAEAIRLFEIEVLYMPLPNDESVRLEQAVERQNLLNDDHSKPFGPNCP